MFPSLRTRAGGYTLAARFAPTEGLQPPPEEQPPPATLLLAAARDDVRNWLRTGQSLHRLLLAAAREGVYATIHTQPIEVPVVRAGIARVTRVRHPQILLQLGHANGIPETPRRPLTDILVRR